MRRLRRYRIQRDPGFVAAKQPLSGHAPKCNWNVAEPTQNNAPAATSSTYHEEATTKHRLPHFLTVMDNSVKVIAVQPCCEAQAEGQSERTATVDETYNGKARLTSKGSKLPVERARDPNATIADNVDEESGVAGKVRTYASAGVKHAGKVANVPCKIEPSDTTVMDNSTTATAGIVVEHDGCGVYVADQSHEREAREIDATSHVFVDPGRAEVTSTVVGALIIEATSNEAVAVETALSEIVIGGDITKGMSMRRTQATSRKHGGSDVDGRRSASSIVGEQ